MFHFTSFFFCTVPLWVYIIIGIVAFLVIVAVVVVIIIVVMKHKAKQTPKSSDLVTVDQSVYMVDDGVNMVALDSSIQYAPPASTDMQQGVQPAPVQSQSDMFSNPESDVTMVQAFQD